MRELAVPILLASSFATEIFFFSIKKHTYTDISINCWENEIATAAQAQAKQKDSFVFVLETSWKYTLG